MTVAPLLQVGGLIKPHRGYLLSMWQTVSKTIWWWMVAKSGRVRATLGVLSMSNTRNHPLSLTSYSNYALLCASLHRWKPPKWHELFTWKLNVFPKGCDMRSSRGWFWTRLSSPEERGDVDLLTDVSGKRVISNFCPWYVGSILFRKVKEFLPDYKRRWKQHAPP